MYDNTRFFRAAPSAIRKSVLSWIRGRLIPEAPTAAVRRPASSCPADRLPLFVAEQRILPRQGRKTPSLRLAIRTTSNRKPAASNGLLNPDAIFVHMAVRHGCVIERLLEQVDQLRVSTNRRIRLSRLFDFAESVFGDLQGAQVVY